MIESEPLERGDFLPERRKTLRRTIPLLFVGLLIFFGYLYFFVDIPEMLTTIQQIDVFYYLLAIIVLMLNMVAYSFTWHSILGPLSIKVSFIKTILITWVGAFVEFFVPSESIGEDISKIYFMAKESGENTGKVVASVLGQRIISMLVTLIVLIACSFWLLNSQYVLPSSVSFLIVLISVGTTIPLIFILLLCLKDQLSRKLIDLLLRFSVFISRGRLDLEKLRFKANNYLEDFHQSMCFLRNNPKSLIQPLFFALISYFLSVLVSFFVFVSLGYIVSFVLVTVVYSISRSLQSVPTMLPGEVGFIEIVMTYLYTDLLVLGPQAAAVSAAATVLTRILWVWLRLPLGFIALQWIVRKGLI